jgi:hypothetical protein
MIPPSGDALFGIVGSGRTAVAWVESPDRLGKHGVFHGDLLGTVENVASVRV